MKEAVPNYYHKFKCIADQCKHSCCIGWEIDIDGETMALYSALDSELGAKIRQNIEGDVPHFVLQEGDRCPFLNDRGLCDIICTYGEDALCDICYLHPRFRNFYSDFFEMGLGLCCEEAARIILTEEELFSVSLPEDVVLSREEQAFFKRRQALFEILQNRTQRIDVRFSRLAEELGITYGFSLENLCNLYLSLERLDEEWTDVLEGLKGYDFDGTIFQEPEFQVSFEQLAVYFVFRHLNNPKSTEYMPVITFALMGCFLMGALCAQYREKHERIGTEQLVEFVRMYSAEVEYSEENMGKLLKATSLYNQ